MNDLKQQLMDLAREKGICLDGYSTMRVDSVDMLVDYYLANPDWCLERDYPTLTILRENFSNIEGRGIFVDKTFHGELLNTRQVYIFHKCRGTVKVGLNEELGIAPMLYVANGCKIRFVGIGEIVPLRQTNIPIYVFDGNCGRARRNSLSAKSNKFVNFIQYEHPTLYS